MANLLVKRFLGKNLGLVKKLPDFQCNYLLSRSVCVFNLPVSHNYNVFSQNVDCNVRNESLCSKYTDYNRFRQIRFYSKKEESEDEDEPKKKLSIFQKFKKMYKEYWYVLLPVHVATSIVWFGGFYYIASSGIDIAAILESWNISDAIVNPLRDSKMGYLAITFALYKLAAPARYAVTLGGTTVAINYLKKMGYIKPVPSRKRLQELYRAKKEDFLDGIKTKSEKLKTNDIVEKTMSSIKKVESTMAATTKGQSKLKKKRK